MNITTLYPNLPKRVNPAFKTQIGHILKPIEERTDLITKYVNNVGYLTYINELDATGAPESLKNKHKLYFLFRNGENNAAIRNAATKNNTIVIQTDTILTPEGYEQLANKLRNSFVKNSGTSGFNEILKTFKGTVISTPTESNFTRFGGTPGNSYVGPFGNNKTNDGEVSSK